MIVHLHEAGRPGRLSGAALAAALLLAVGACTDYALGSLERTPADSGEHEAATQRDHVAAAPEERMPPPFEPADAAPPEPRGKPTSLLLTVGEGDSVHRIARRHGVAARDIIALNGLSEPYWLLVGQRIRIPLGPARAAHRGEPPVEETWPAARNGTRVTTTEIAAPAPQVQIAAAEPLAPARDTDVTESETASPPRDPTDAPAAVDRTDPPVFGDDTAPVPPEAPAHREARADPAQPASISALARQADGAAVPLPPTRNTFLWPAEGRVISRFGSKPGGMHNDGINIAVPMGTAVRAAQNGVVAYAGNELRGYGNLVLIRHEDGWMTAYAHNDSLLVGKGDVVERGQVISRSGKSGRVSRPQAHFEIRRNGEPQDPLRLLTRK